jgi:bacterioferritin-associated ferredoxin
MGLGLDSGRAVCQADQVTQTARQVSVDYILGDSIKVEVVGDEIAADKGLDRLRVKLLSLKGSPPFVRAAQAWVEEVSKTGKLPQVNMDGFASLLLGELNQKIKGQFQELEPDSELCHCRGVPAANVDRAIVGGCLTIKAVSRATSAGTSCGTCQPEIQDRIESRLKTVG